MAAITTTTVPANVPTPTSAKGIVDMLVAQRMLNIVSNISNSDNSSFISLKQIGGLLALLSLEEVRTLIGDAISYFREFIKSSTILSTIKNTIIFVIVKIKNIIWKRKEIKDIIIPIIKPIQDICEFELDNKLLIAILNFMISKEQLTYVIDYKEIKYETSKIKTGMKIEKWNTISFENDSIKYTLCNKLNVTKNNLTNMIASITNMTIPIETDEYRLISKEGFCRLKNRIFHYKDSHHYFVHLMLTKKDYTTVSSYNITIKHKSTQNINVYSFELKQPYYDINSKCLAYLAYLCKLYETTTNTRVTTEIFNCLTGSNDYELIEYNFTHDMNDVIIRNSYNYQQRLAFKVEMASKGYFVEWKTHICVYNSSELMTIIPIKTEEFVPDYKFNANNCSKEIILSAYSNIKTPTEITDSFDKLLKSVCADATTFEKDKYVSQKTHFLSISRKTKVEQIPNPEFDSWLEMKNVLSPAPAAVPDKAKEETDKSKISDFERMKELSMLTSLPPPPPKTLKKESEVVEVVCKELGTCYKPLDTLYISEYDMNTLTSSIEMFRDQKDMLKELGLPNKYGLFLSGPPGTGKTSTIYAVATYLQKPIYYIGLNDVHTNRELSMLIEHVYEKTVEGGIIVFEDIDAMTDIVLSRDSALSDSSIVSIMKDEESELTLSYFLNLLDGIMSRDGMITIASSNYPEKLDAAFLRDGRFDIHIRLGYANKFQIAKIFKMFFKRAISNEILDKVPEGRYTPANFIFRFKTFVLRPEIDDAKILESFLNVEQTNIE